MVWSTITKLRYKEKLAAKIGEISDQYISSRTVSKKKNSLNNLIKNFSDYLILNLLLKNGVWNGNAAALWGDGPGNGGECHRDEGLRDPVRIWWGMGSNILMKMFEEFQVVGSCCVSPSMKR
jgi:hypothetical protein